MYKMYYVTHNHQTGYANYALDFRHYIIKPCQAINIPRIAVALINHKKFSTAMNVCFHSKRKKFLV